MSVLGNDRGSQAFENFIAGLAWEVRNSRKNHWWVSIEGEGEGWRWFPVCELLHRGGGHLWVERTGGA